MEKIMLPKQYTLRTFEVAEMAGVSEHAIRRAAKKGLLPSRLNIATSERRFNERDVREWIDKNFQTTEVASANS